MTYSNSVCLGNWFEDRVQKASGKKGGRIIADYGYRIFDTDASRTWGIKEVSVGLSPLVTQFLILNPSAPLTLDSLPL